MLIIDCSSDVCSSDLVMRSGVTGIGAYPIITVETVARIDASTEANERDNMAAITWNPRTRGGVIAKAAAEVGHRVNAKFLCAFTQSGDSARRLSRYRSSIPVLAFTPLASTRSQLSMSWGVETFKTAPVEHTDEMVRQVDEALLK